LAFYDGEVCLGSGVIGDAAAGEEEASSSRSAAAVAT